MENIDNDVLPIKTDRIWNRVKRSLFKKELYNQRTLTFKIAATAIFLAMAVGLSLLELFSIPMPWGATFGLRFFDTLVIIYSISIVGLGFALLESMILPWIHNMIDGHHTWLEMAFFMLSNFLVVFITWFIYYIVFNAYYKVRIPENIEDHSIHEYHFVKKPHDHHHKVAKITMVKKILAFIIIVPSCAIIETLAMLVVAKILLNTGQDSMNIHDHIFIQNLVLVNKQEILENFKITPHIQYHVVENGHSDGLSSIFDTWQNILIFISIFFGVFTGKYIINAILFLVLERRTRQLVDRYGIYV